MKKNLSPTILGIVCAVAFLLPSLPLFAWTPGTGFPEATGSFSVDTSNRTDVLAFYNTAYIASEDYASKLAWTGAVTTGTAGTTSSAFKDDVLRRINFFRALAGLPADISFDDTLSAKAQQAALMMSANKTLSHYPAVTWLFYSAEGAEAAGKGNLAYGSYGPLAIDRYMEDAGSNNLVAGHRRWLLYPRAQEMGTGDIPENGIYSATNATWVVGNFKASVPAGFTMWPNAGYVPQDIVPARWSLSYPNADFSNASVTVTAGGVSIPVSVISRTDTGLGDNSIVWEPANLTFSGSSDKTVEVTVSGIAGAEVTSTSYTVRPFNADNLGNSVTISGTSDAPVEGAEYTFNSIAQADAYQLRISTGTTAAWLEGGESSARIIDDTATSYSLTQTALVASGTAAFHLTFPSFEDGPQGFEIDRDIVPSSTSALQFRDRFRWATTTSRLDAEVSSDGGASWVSVWNRSGNGGTSSNNWDSAFNVRSVSLAAYIGKPIRVRFVYRSTGSAFIGSGLTTGVFLDAITVTNANQLTSAKVTTLDKAASGFTLDATTTGAPLINGALYYCRIRPNVGTRWFGDGPLKVITCGTIQTRVVSLSGTLSFGRRTIRTRTVRNLSIKNTGNAPLVVSAVKVPTGFLGSWSGTIAPGGTRVVPITFNPRLRKAYRGSATVVCNSTSGVITKLVSGTGK